MDTKERTIAFGNKRYAISFPAKTQELTIGEPEVNIDSGTFCTRLDHYLSQHPFDVSEPMLVVADKTRLCGYPTYLPLLIRQLEKQGMDREKLRIVIAYGTHPRQSDEECLTSYGEIYNQLSFIHHNCHDEELFVELGQTSKGTPIRHRLDLLEASAIITMGPICHHYFAGYGGGRKLIFPGCGELKAIYQNHGLYLDSVNEELSPSCQPGVIDKNPLADDLFEIEAKNPADLAIHGILDSHGNITDMIFGKGRKDYLGACALHGKSCEITSEPFDTVVASCGGIPKDINFIQSHKAIHNAAMFVQDGGLLVIYCECRDGIGSRTFLPWFEAGGFLKAFHKLSCAYEGNGGTALAMMTKLQRITIAMITNLDEATCRHIGIEKWYHHEVGERVQQREGSLAWIANASLLVKRK